MTTPVVYLDTPEYDQLAVNDLILRHAVRLMAAGHVRAWFVLPEYDIRLSDYVLAAVEEKLDVRASFAFRVFIPKGVRTCRKTLPTENYDLHGGVYLLNLEDYIDRLYSSPLGTGCHTNEMWLAERRRAVRGVVTYTNEEWRDSGLRRIRSTRSRVLDTAGLFFVDRLLNDESSIRQHHENLFAEQRRDLLVFDADYLPVNAESLGKELWFLPDAGNDVYVHVWHCRNPVNGLVYGHGAPKLFPRKAQLRRRSSNLVGDFTLSVGDGLVEHEVCIGVHAFNWSEFSTWRTAAKETAKLRLASDTDSKARERHDVWVDPDSLDRNAAYADLCLAGAQFGSSNPRTVLSLTSEDLLQSFNDLRGA